MEHFIEEEFRKVSSREIQTAKRRFRDGEGYIKESLPENNINSEYDSQELLNAAGETFAFSAEHGLKSNIIYDDFRKSPFFTQIRTTKLQLGNKYINAPIVGTSDWYKTLAGNISPLNFIIDPKEIRKNIILNNDPNDDRLNIKTEPQFNSQFLTLSLDGSKISGHSLYAYYQLQNSVVKSLINTEYYCYVDDEAKYTIYALLTEDILTNNNEGKTIIPSDFMEKLDSVKNAAVDLRYASISFENIDNNELIFLKEFSSSIISVGEYRFPLPKQYAEINFEKFNYNDFVGNDFNIFNNLDKMTKYYLQSCFSKKEIMTFKKYANILIKSGINSSDLNVFINNSIYFKNYINNKMQINLEFTEKQFTRIYNFCKLIKAFQPFDSNSKRLSDNEAFSTEEKKNIYISKIEQNKYINKNRKIGEYIEKVNNGYIQEGALGDWYIPRFKDGIESFCDYCFWIENKKKIITELETNPKYEIGYEKAKKMIDDTNIDKKIAEYIEKLNNGYIPKLKDSSEYFSNGSPVNVFWAKQRLKIITELETNPKYQVGYELSKKILNEILNDKSIDKIAEYIEKLNNGYFPKSNDPNECFSDKSTVNYFWLCNKEKIIKELETNPKYQVGYELAKNIIKENTKSKLSWEKIYEYAKKYYEHYGDLKVPSKFKTNNGYEYAENGEINLGMWINAQRQRVTPESERGQLLSNIGMIWDVKKNKEKIEEICIDNNIDLTINKKIIEHISIQELQSKILFLQDNGMSIINNDGKLHEIFSMSNLNMKVQYGINMEELISKYYINSNGKGLV